MKVISLILALLNIALSGMWFARDCYAISLMFAVFATGCMADWIFSKE